MKSWPLQRILRHLGFWVLASGLLLLMQLPNPLFMGTRLYLRMYVLTVLPGALQATYLLLYDILPRLLRQRRARPVSDATERVADGQRPALQPALAHVRGLPHPTVVWGQGLSEAGLEHEDNYLQAKPS
jgi:hypothetical protein